MTLNEVTGTVTAVSFTVGAPDSFATSVGSQNLVTTPDGSRFQLLGTLTSTVVSPEPSGVVLIGTAITLMGALLWFKRGA
jgi:hypothetical protein